MSVTFILTLILLGAFVGVAAGLLGIGGGGILVPILTSLFLWQGVPKTLVVHLALGTSMACIMVTSISSMLAHHKNGAVIWSIAKVLAPSMMVGTFLATFLAAVLSPLSLAIFFSGFMAYVAISMLVPKKAATAQIEHITSLNPIEASAVGMGIGAVSALVSIGGGSLTVPYLNWRRINIKHAIGTSAALGFPIAVAGTLGYGWNGYEDSALRDAHMSFTWGYIYLPALLLVAVPSFLTAPIGARCAQTLPTPILKRLFGGLLLLLSLKMLWSIV